MATYHYEDATVRKQPTRITDRNGRTVLTLTYVDAHLASAQDFAGREVAYSYTGGTTGRLATVTDALQTVTTYSYTPFGLLGGKRTHLAGTPPESDHILTVEYYPQNLREMVKTLSHSTGERKSFSYHFDEATRLYHAVVTTASGVETTSAFDLLGVLISRDVDGERVYHKIANENTRVITVGDDQVTRQEFNEYGYLTRTVFPDGGIETYEYDPVRHKVLRHTDPEGAVTAYTYDALGNVLTLTQAAGTPDARVTTSTYFPHSDRVQFTTMPDGRKIGHEYYTAADGLHLDGLLKRTYFVKRAEEADLPDDALRQMRYTYDSLGRIATTTDALDHVTSYLYDAADRIIEETNALGEKTLSTYQGDNLVQLEVGRTSTAWGLISRYSYDAAGRRLSESRVDTTGLPSPPPPSPGQPAAPYAGTAPEVLFKTYAYDNDGRLSAETNALGQIITYGYDSFGYRSLVSVPDADGGLAQTHTVNDTLGRPTRTTDAEGHVTTTSYDLQDRPAVVTEAAGTPLARTTTYTYDKLGRVLSETLTYAAQPGVESTTTYTYDLLGRRTGLGGNRPYATTRTYDPSDRLLTETDALGRVNSFTYDRGGFLTGTYRAPNATATPALLHGFERDRLGNMTRVTDGEGNHIHYRYDALGRITHQSIALKGATLNPSAPAQTLPESWWLQPAYVLVEQTFTSFNELKSQTRHSVVDGVVRSAVTTYGYDAFGRLASEQDPAGLVKTYGYDAADNLLAITYPPVPSSGATTPTTERFLRSPHNATVVDASIDRAGHATHYTYDGLFRWLTETNSLGGVVTRTYDALGRVDTETTPPPTGSNTQGVVRTTYDLHDQPLTITHPDHVAGTHDRIETYVYDSHGKETHKTGAGDYPLIRRYDAVGNLREMQDADGRLTKWSYTYRNQIETKTYADEKTQLYTYDGAGRVESYTDSLSRTTTYEYNPLGRLVLTDYPTNIDVEMDYDQQGRILSMTDGSGVTSWTYDDAGRIKTEAQGMARTTLTYDYDAHGQRTSLSVLRTMPNAPPAWRTSYGWDNAGRLKTVLDERLPSGRPFVYAYSPSADLLTGITSPAGHQTGKGYDAFGRLTSWSATTAGGASVNSHVYTLDAMGRPVTEDASGRVRTFTHDAQGQIQEVSTLPSGGVERFAFTYDQIGNRDTTTVAGVPGGSLPTGVTDYTANSVNQYTALTGAMADAPEFDDNGNTTSLRGMDFRYDEEYRLVEAYDATRTILYTYDGLNRRVARQEIPVSGPSTLIRYVYDGMRVIEELAENDQPLRSYTRGIDLSATMEEAGGIGGLLAMARPAGSAWTSASYCYDGHGNVTELVDEDAATSGAIVARYTYGPFGERLSATGPLADINPYQYSTKERDAFTGHYYFGYRFYDPLTGRWMNRDPLEESGGLNIYAYVDNAPGTYMDPFGLCSMPASDLLRNVGKGALAGAGGAALYGDSAGVDQGAGGWDSFRKGFGDGFRNALTPKNILLGIGIAAAMTFASPAILTAAAIGGAVALVNQAVGAALSDNPAYAFGNMAGESTAGAVTGGVGGALRKGCFVAGTEISMADGPRVIEDIQVGDRVLTPDSYTTALDTSVDPATWRKLTLRLVDPSDPDNPSDLVLLRPLTWVESANGVEGGQIWLEFNELNLRGWALVLAIEACPEIQPGIGRVVLATVTQLNADVMKLTFADGSSLSPTASHPLFSETRDQWIAAEDVLIGEQLRTRSGKVFVQSSFLSPTVQSVYNLEVEFEHCYFAGDGEILAHNGCGSYTIEFASGKRYHGKGDYNRALKSAKEHEARRKLNNWKGDKAVKIDWKTAKGDRESFKDEARRIRGDGGIKNPNNYNEINSPGEKYLIQDGCP